MERPPLNLIEICPTIERVTSYPHLLIASACNDRQKNIFEAIEKYSKTAEKPQETLKEFIVNIWEKYPVIYEIVDEDYLINKGIWRPFFEKCDDYNNIKNNDIITLYRFDADKMDASNIKLTDEENEVLGKVWESLINRVVSNSNTYDDSYDSGFEILWRGNVHRDMTHMAVHWFLEGTCDQSREFVDLFANVASSHSDNPDCLYWVESKQMGRFEECIWDCWFEWNTFLIVKNLFMGSPWHCEWEAYRKWTHSYINISDMWNISGGWMGGAPEEAHHFGLKARNYVNANRFVSAAVNLGFASHFLTDVGQPMHTGRVGTQLWESWWGECIHTEQYYDFIRDNWGKGDHDFKNAAMQDNIGWWFIGTNDPRNCPDYVTKALAGFSNRYVNTLVDGIVNDPEGWQNCSKIINLTRDVIIVSMRLNRGFIWYIFQDIIQ